MGDFALIRTGTTFDRLRSGVRRNELYYDTDLKALFIGVGDAGNEIMAIDVLAYGEVNLGNVTGAVELDNTAAGVISMTLTGNVTFSFKSVPPAGHVDRLEIRMTQGGSGFYEATWPAGGSWPSGTSHSLSNTVGQTDIAVITLNDDGTWNGELSKSF